jgi:hypothetical protein
MVIDISTGREEETLLYGYGHVPARGRGRRAKDDDQIDRENEAEKRHIELLKEFSK